MKNLAIKKNKKYPGFWAYFFEGIKTLKIWINIVWSPEEFIRFFVDLCNSRNLEIPKLNISKNNKIFEQTQADWKEQELFFKVPNSYLI